MQKNMQTGKGETRTFIYQKGFDMFKSHPFIGKQIFLDIDGKVYYPHNLFLEILMSLGLLGFSLYLYILFALYRKLRLLKGTSVYFILLFIFFFGMAQVSGNLFSNVELWNIMAVLFTLKSDITIK
jgi:O-antigen ligase